MPGKDGTGPTGTGPMTGRALGLCTDTEETKRGFFRGRGGLGLGLGRGHGFGRRFAARQASPEDQKHGFKNKKPSCKTVSRRLTNNWKIFKLSEITGAISSYLWILTEVIHHGKAKKNGGKSVLCLITTGLAHLIHPLMQVMST